MVKLETRKKGSRVELFWFIGQKWSFGETIKSVACYGSCSNDSVVLLIVLNAKEIEERKEKRETFYSMQSNKSRVEVS